MGVTEDLIGVEYIQRARPRHSLSPDQAMASENSSLSEGVTCLGATTRAYGHREA